MQSDPASAEPADDQQYLEAITSCGEQRSLVVSQPIYSATGIKLLERGAKFDRRVLDRLFGHTLRDPIDRCVASDEAVRHSDLVARARELVAATPLLAHFQTELAARSNRLWSALADCPLPPAVAMRLTVARDSSVALYEHSLRAAFTALFIGVCAKYSERDLQMLATAALLHDIGMLHVDPHLFDGARPLDAAGRRSLQAHPVTGELIAQREPLLNRAIAAAIAQHHERLDGTGYPRGLAGEAIEKFARVLMLVEVVLALAEHPADRPERQLSLVLRLNHRSFDGRLSDIVLAALPRLPPDESPAAASWSECRRALELLDAWTRLCAANPPAADDPASAFIAARIGRLRRWLADAGVGDPDAAALAAEEVAVVSAEVAALAHEAHWHARQIALDALGQWPRLATREGETASGAAEQWICQALTAREATP